MATVGMLYGSSAVLAVLVQSWLGWPPGDSFFSRAADGLHPQRTFRIVAAVYDQLTSIVHAKLYFRWNRECVVAVDNLTDSVLSFPARMMHLAPSTDSPPRMHHAAAWQKWDTMKRRPILAESPNCFCAAGTDGSVSRVRCLLMSSTRLAGTSTCTCHGGRRHSRACWCLSTEGAG